MEGERTIPVWAKAAFCFVCGSATKMAYPGGDPENGPAHMRCKADPSHMSMSDAIDDALDRERPEDFRNSLCDLAGEGMFGGMRENPAMGPGQPQYVEIPQHVRLAALVLLADESECLRISRESAEAEEARMRAIGDALMPNVPE